MSDRVDLTLKLWRRGVFIYGQTDCLLSIGDYLASRGGRDISSRFRGTYSDAAGALTIVEAHDGPQGLIDLCGFPRLDLDEYEPQRGDVVVLDTGRVGVERLVGALCTGAGIAARLERGVIEVERRFVRLSHAWKVV